MLLGQLVHGVSEPYAMTETVSHELMVQAWERGEGRPAMMVSAEQRCLPEER